MSIASQIKPLVIKALKELYDLDLAEKDITVNITKPEFEGDYTVVLFAFIKTIKKSAEQILYLNRLQTGIFYQNIKK